MKIHGLCIVKNEGDVVEECLRAATAWCDHIYVLDNGSDDGTWEIVQRLAGELPQVVPFKQDDAPFDDGLRAQVYRAYRDRAQSDDWWCRLDADEFYVTDPRAFLCALPSRYGVVYYASLSYYFSSAAAEQYKRDPSAFADDVPVAERCRYYFAHWSEPRFVRHDAMGDWEGNSGNGWPPGIFERTTAAPVRILAKHYCYRSPQQIERRISTRASAALSGKVFAHEAIQNWSAVVDPKSVTEHKWRDIAYVTQDELLERGWESRVIPAESLQYDAHDGHYVVREDLMPPIPEPPLGGELARVGSRLLDEIKRAPRRVLSAVKRRFLRRCRRPARPCSGGQQAREGTD